MRAKLQKMSVTKYCIVCLNTGVKFYSLKDYTLGQIYSDLTKIPVINWNQHLCIECAYLIQKYQKFKLKCLRTDDILSETVSLTGLTESVLEKMQEKFKIGPLLAYSEITTEDVTVIDPDCSNIEEIKPEISDDDNGLFILLKNDNMPVEYSKENLSISDKSTVKSAEIHNRLSLNPRVVLERLDVTKRIQTSVTLKPNDTCNDLWYDSDFNNIDDDNTLNDDSHSNSSWTNALNYIENLSDSTNLINDPNNKHFSKLKSDDNMKNFSENKNLSKVQKGNNRIHFKTIFEHVKKAVTKIDKPICDVSESNSIVPTVPTGNWGRFTKSEFTAKLVENLQKDGHTVQFLTKEQATNEVLNRAKSDKYIRSEYKCNLCYRGYSKQETLANHMLTHSPERGPYICEYCQCRFPEKRYHTHHMYNVHILKFSCKLCPFVCDQLDRATNHVRSHKGKTYDCKFCDKKFRFSNTLSHHTHWNHRDKYETQYICELCGNSFHSKNGLSTHKSKIHLNESNEKLGPACEQCGIHFASQQAWDRHLVVSNNHPTQNSTVAHKPRKPRTRISLNYTCEFCGIVLYAEYLYKKHLHKHHDHPKPSQNTITKNFICEICGEKYSNKLHFKSHMLKHTGELPFACQFCGKRYRLQMSLKLHENSHTRADIYKCDVCNKEFLLRASYSRHMKSHMGLTPHKCLQCDRSFVNPSLLNTHIKHKHERFPYPKRAKARTKSPRGKTKTAVHLPTLHEEK